MPKRKATTNIQSEVKKLKPSLPAIVSLDRTFSDEPVSESMSDEIFYVPKPVVHSRKAILIDLSLEIGDGVPLSETPLPMDIQEEPNETVFDTELNVSHDLAVRALPDEFCHHLPIIDTRIAKILKGIPSLKMYKMLNASESNELDAIIVESQITGLPTCFVIGKISNDLGSGIFYTGTESLKKYKIVGLYSGVHQFRREGEDDTPTTDLAYTINVTNSYFKLSKKEHSTMYKKAKYNKNDQYAVVCSSKDKGNWTRLINHATDKFANIAYSLRKYNYLENDEHRSNYVILATVIRPILPGEQLLVNYGSSYWHGKNKPTPVAAKTFTYSNNGVQKM